MRLFFLLLLLPCAVLYAGNNYSFDYFVSHYDLKLPEITEDMLEQTAFTTQPDSTIFLYYKDSGKMRREICYYDTSVFRVEKKVNEFSYRQDTTIINGISIDFRTGDTVNFYTKHLTNHGLISFNHDYRSKCGNGYTISYVEYGPLMVNQNSRRRCSDATQWKGYRTEKKLFKGYIETNDVDITTKKRINNFNRRFYLSSSDSVVAQCFFVPETGKESLASLIKYKNNSRLLEYNFFSDKPINNLYQIIYHRYDNSGICVQSYFFSIQYSDSSIAVPQLDYIIDYRYNKSGKLFAQTVKRKK